MSAIQFLGVADIQISHLKLPGDWRMILELPAVEARAQSIDAVGLLQYPVVRKSDHRLLAGRKRVAAHCRLNRESIKCLFVECDDVQAEIIERTENGERDHDPGQQRVDQMRVVELLAKAAKDVPLPEHPGRGRKPTTKGAAIRLLAQERGVTEHAVRVALCRERNRKHEEEVRIAEEAGLPPPPKLGALRAVRPPVEAKAAPIDNPWGIPCDAAFYASCEAVNEYLHEVRSSIIAAIKRLTQLRNAELPVDLVKIDRAKDGLLEVRALVDGMKIVMLCPYCKGLPNVTPKCGGCATRAYITKAQLESVPEEFLRTQNPVVLWEGQIYPMSEFIAQPEQQELPLEPVPQPEEKGWEL